MLGEWAGSAGTVAHRFRSAGQRRVTPVVSRCRCSMSPAAALCVLSGLPAAGKSRLARELRGRARARGWRTLLVTYDDLIPARDWRQVRLSSHYHKHIKQSIYSVL